MKDCALEVSSHGLAQGRVDAIHFDAAVFTNFTYDHLDFHGTMENYFDAKSKLFKEQVKADGVCILNMDDPRYKDLERLSKARVVSYGIDSEADYRAIDIQMTSTSSHFNLVHQGRLYPVMTNLVARYNIYNLLAAIAALHETGMPFDRILPACENLPQIKAGWSRSMRDRISM